MDIETNVVEETTSTEQQEVQTEVTTNQNVTVAVTPESTESNSDEEQSQKPEPTGQETDENAQQRVDAQTKANEDLKADLSKKGVDWADLEKTYTETGELTETQLKALEQAGYPKSVVDAYIRGMEAEYERLATRIVESAGSTEEFQRLQNFASQQGEEYREMWNGIINSGNIMSIRTMLQGVRSDMQQLMGTNNPTILGGTGGNASANTGFNSRQEMIEAMSDPRYGKDKTYTREVEQKTIKSKLF